MKEFDMSSYILDQNHSNFELLYYELKGAQDFELSNSNANIELENIELE